MSRVRLHPTGEAARRKVSHAADGTAVRDASVRRGVGGGDPALPDSPWVDSLCRFTHEECRDMADSNDEVLVEPREAVAGDAATLAGFNRAMALETESKSLPMETLLPGVEAVLRDPDHGFYVVADAGSGIAGALLVTYEWSDWRNGRLWWIQSVYVRPDFRRRGVYRSLHGFVRDRARAAGSVVGIRLHVERENVAAQRTYAALGMTETPYRIYEEMLR